MKNNRIESLVSWLMGIGFIVFCCVIGGQSREIRWLAGIVLLAIFVWWLREDAKAQERAKAENERRWYGGNR